MASIHIPGDGHIAPTGRHKWLAYSDADKKQVVEAALFILKHNIKGSKPCNDCFKRLPGGRSFDDVLNDAGVFISFDPSTKKDDFGATIGSDVTITDFSIRMGRWTVAATLVHELAHVNGAPGGDRRRGGKHAAVLRPEEAVPPRYRRPPRGDARDGGGLNGERTPRAIGLPTPP